MCVIKIMNKEKLNKTDMYKGYNEKHVWQSWIGLALFVMLSICDAAAQTSCVVGGTDFETSEVLCNPQLTNDEDGWFSPKVAQLLKTETAGCNYYLDYTKVSQKGFKTNKMQVPGAMITPAAWKADSLIQSATTNIVGYSAIVQNPKLISPVLSEGNGTGMLVNFGTSHDASYVLGYVVSGLEPNSTVTFTCDVYNLIDMESLAAKATAEGSTKNITLCGRTYNVQQDKIYDPMPTITYSSGDLDGQGRMPNSKKETPTISWGEKYSLKITGKADMYGTAQFYLGRTGGLNSMPIGIDNVEIKGNIKPTITGKKDQCFGSMISLGLKQQYPAGSTYKWKEASAGEISTDPNLYYEAKETDKNYTFTCEVTIPGGCSGTSDKFVVNVKTCCDDGNTPPTPLPYTDIYYEDFGNFSGNQYTYTDLNGREKTVTATDHLKGDPTEAFCVQDYKTGGDAFPEIKYSKAIYDGPGDYYAISASSIYTGGVSGDNTTKGNGGGFMMIDLQEAGYLNKAIFEKQICGLCPNRDIVYDAYFAGINGDCQRLDGLTAKFQLQLVDDATGKYLVDKEIDIPCGGDWNDYGGPFNITTSSEGCVTMKIIALEDDYSSPSGGNGDFGIDDIRFQVCTPPNAELDHVLTGNAKDLLDLCTGDVLTLQAKLTDNAKKFYGTPYYLFQYTYDNPEETDADEIVWYDLTDENGEKYLLSPDLDIKEPATHKAFEKIQAGDEAEVYFRVVAAKLETLKNPDELKVGPLSPCRNISVSNMYVTASLNCAACSDPDKSRTFTSDKGRLNGKELRLCKEDGKATIGLKNPIHGIDKDGKDYSDYDVTWYKEKTTSTAIASKKCTASNNTAPTIEVDWSDVTESGTKYIISLHDYFDPTQPVTPCDITDTIIVYADPAPTTKLDDPDPFCEGTLTSDPTMTISGYQIQWYEDEDTTKAMTSAPSVASTLAADSPAEYYYALIDSKTGCRGDANLYTIVVNPIPEETLPAIEEFCQGDASAKLPASSLSYEVNWYTNATATSAAETDLSALEGKTTPYSYYYTLTDKSKTPNCTSDPVQYDFTVKPTAEVIVTVTPECDETKITTTTKPANATVNWTIDGTTPVNDAASITVDNVTYKAGKYEAIASATGYCDSKPDEKTVNFNSTPDPINVTIDEYLKADGTPDYSKIDAKVNALKAADPNVSIYWSGVLGSTAEDQSSSMTAPTTGYTTSRVNPSPDLANTDDEFFYYWIYQELKNSEVTCPSEKKIVVVPILGAPAPIVHDTIYCLNSEKVASLSENVKINQAKAGVTYELVWKDGVDESTVPSVSTVGKTTYEVAQRDKNNPSNISAYRKINVEVRGVKEPNVAANKLAYCANDVAQTLTVTKVDDNANYYYASNFEWFLNGSSVSTTPTPNTAVSSTTTYHYGVRQTYTIPTSNEVCYGDTSVFDVKVTFVPQLTVSQVTYLKANANSAGTFDKNVKEQLAEVYSGEEPGSTINWYNSNGSTCDATALGGTPTPTVDPSVGVGKDQTVFYCVSQTVDGCEGETNIVKVVISDAPNPKVTPVSYCEGETTNSLTAEINELTNPASSYKLIWYDENHSKLSEGPTGPTPTSNMRAGDDKTSTYKYYVTQQLLSTGAESTESEIIVTIYANPTLTITTPATVCEKQVQLPPTVTLNNEVPGQTYIDKYFSDATGTSTLASSNVDESGTYYVQYSYNANVTSGVVCVSKVMPIVVTIDTLNVITPDTVNTCPAMTATLSSTVETNVSPVTYAWSGDGENGSTTEKFTTHAFAGDYGDVYNYSLTVKAGTCSQTNPIVVQLGEGPLVGKLILTDATKTKDVTVEFKDGMTAIEPYYYCGGNVSVTPEYEGSGDYKLTSPSGSSVSSSTFSVAGEGQYRLDFTNGCPTKLFFILKNAEISLTNTTPELVMCEDDKFTSTVTVTPLGLDYSLVWKKDGSEITGQTSETYTIENTIPSNSGLYTVEADRYGCPAKTEIGQLVVKPYIKVIENKNPYIVPRGESQTLTIQFTEPSDGNLQNIEWYDNGDATAVENAGSHTESDVQKDHKYIIKMSDDNYCNAETEMNIWVDAVLQMKTSLADVQCYNMQYELKIDTTGTGAFRQEGVDHFVKVQRTMNGSTIDMSDQLKLVKDTLVLTVTADKDASYAIHFEYGTQTIDSIEVVTVIPAISVTLPATPTICEGEEVELKVTNVVPEGTTITWNSDNTILGTNEGEVINVKPKYSESANHQYVYSYYLEAYNAACNNKENYIVNVNVDEALKGMIEGDSPICETKSSTISAASYDASSYEWSTSGVPAFATTATTVVTPLETSLYVVDMKRGTCTAQDQFTVVVTSNPKILAMDSAGIRDRQVVTDPERGTGVFSYWLDNNKSTMTTFDIIKNLAFGSHVISVIDENGCTSSFNFTLDPPEIIIPEFFTPNGDGIHDQWIVGKLAEVYPNAVVYIFDRFGKLVGEYLGDDADGWDGTYNGVNLPSTDYWYMIDIAEIERQYTGHFTLIRR